MTRRQLRENVFKMLFRVEFHDEKEMPEQLALFEDEVEPISEDEKIYMIPNSIGVTKAITSLTVDGKQLLVPFDKEQ